MSAVNNLASDQDVPEAARAWVRQFQRTHPGEKLTHNTFVDAMYRTGLLGRDEARKAYHAIMGTQPRPRRSSPTPKEETAAMPMPTPMKPTVVNPTPVQARMLALEERVVALERAQWDVESRSAQQQRTIARQDARIASLEQALREERAFRVRLTQTVEVCQQTLQLLARVGAELRKDPDATKEFVRQVTRGNKRVSFPLMEALGLSLSPNEEREKQLFFSQGLLS